MKLTSNRKNFNEHFPYGNKDYRYFFFYMVERLSQVKETDPDDIYLHCQIISSNNQTLNFISSSFNERKHFLKWVKDNSDNAVVLIVDILSKSRRLTMAFNQHYHLDEINIDTPNFTDQEYGHKHLTMIIPCLPEITISNQGSLIWIAGEKTAYFDFSGSNNFLTDYFKRILSDSGFMGDTSLLYRNHYLNANLVYNFLNVTLVEPTSDFTLRKKEALDMADDLKALPHMVVNTPNNLDLEWFNSEINSFSLQHSKIYENGLAKLADKGLL